MCGFAGVINKQESSSRLEAVLARMGDAIAHRGPDDYGTFVPCQELMSLCLSVGAAKRAPTTAVWCSNGYTRWPQCGADECL